MTDPATSEPELRCTKCGSADIHTRNLRSSGPGARVSDEPPSALLGPLSATPCAVRSCRRSTSRCATRSGDRDSPTTSSRLTSRPAALAELIAARLDRVTAADVLVVARATS